MLGYLFRALIIFFHDFFQSSNMVTMLLPCYYMVTMLLHWLLYLQQHHRVLDDISLPSHHTHSGDIQNIIHRIKSSEFSHLLLNKYPEKVR